jgi:hypothetical protein
MGEPVVAFDPPLLWLTLRPRELRGARGSGDFGRGNDWSICYLRWQGDAGLRPARCRIGSRTAP